ncbi:MAG TPA: EAL domain-containing protein [Gallionellaceae bacterium]|nr:EAL domain-containing protein [Gallionellaceae bacterium]
MKRRLAYIISLPVLIAALLSFVLVYAVVESREVGKVEAEAMEYADAIATHLQNTLNAQLASGRLAEARLSLSVSAVHPGMINLLLSDEHDRILLANRYILEGEPAAQLGAYDSAVAGRARQTAAPQMEFTARRDRLVGYYPVTLKIAEKELGLKNLGVLFLEYDLSGQLRRERREALLYSASFGAMLLLSAVLVILLLRRQVSSRIEKLVEATRQFAHGEAGVRIDLPGNDEIAHLGQTFNVMAAQRERVEQALADDIGERKRIEAALQFSKDQYDRLTANIPIGVYLLRTTPNFEFEFMYVSARFCAMLGMKAEDLYADSSLAFRIVHPDDMEKFLALNSDAVNKCESFRWEGRMQINGVTRWMRIESEPESTAGGGCIWDGIVEDITERKQVQLELERNRNLLFEAQRLGHLGSWELDLPSGELRWSDEIFRIFELDPRKFMPTYENFLSVVHPADRDKVNDAYSRSLQDRQAYSIEHRLLLPDGRIKWVREQCSSDFDAAGKPLRSVGAVQDITEQKLTEERLRIAAVTFEMHEAIMITDANARILRVNQAFQDITGYSAEEVLGKNPRILSSGRQDAAFYAAFWRALTVNGAWSGEIWDRRKNGQIYPKWLNVTAVKNKAGEVTEYVAIFSDITARKQAEEEIRNLAFYDALTHLPNRRLLLDRFRLALSVSARSNQYGAVMFLDLDRFKTLNDSMGHEFGDLLLVQVAGRIQSCIREMDTVARLGGDEFVVLVEEVGEDAEEVSQKVAQIAEKIRAALALPYVIKGHECHSSPSIGVALYRGNLESVDNLLKHADLAMYQAKDAGRNAVRFFDPMMQQAVENRAALEADLRSAVSKQQLRLHYQVQIDNEQRPLGAEALIRWQHPVRGMVSPAQFIPVAEESSLILEIGNWVLDAACQQLARWARDPQRSNLVIAVNVSAHQFMKLDFVERVSAALRMHQVSPERLKLELTESMVLADINDVVKKMHALKALGVRLSMDDFGTGYSSLSYLKQLPLDQIKIDQSFVRDVISDPNDAVLVKTIIDMAQNFRLDVIAEGVETEAQLDFLRQNGCMAYQGYLFGKPVPIEQLEILLEEQVR